MEHNIGIKETLLSLPTVNPAGMRTLFGARDPVPAQLAAAQSKSQEIIMAPNLSPHDRLAKWFAALVKALGLRGQEAMTAFELTIWKKNVKQWFHAQAGEGVDVETSTRAIFDVWYREGKEVDQQRSEARVGLQPTAPAARPGSPQPCQPSSSQGPSDGEGAATPSPQLLTEKPAGQDIQNAQPTCQGELTIDSDDCFHVLHAFFGFKVVHGEVNLDDNVELPCLRNLQIELTKMHDAKAMAQAWTRGGKDKPLAAPKRDALIKSLEQAKGEFISTYRSAVDAQHSDMHVCVGAPDGNKNIHWQIKI